MRKISLILTILLVIAVASSGLYAAESQVRMFQAFYWDCPTGWYSTIKSNGPALKTAGFNYFWFPPPSRGMGGTSSMGYDIMDNYNLTTRFGDAAALKAAAAACGNVLLDLVCNHMMGASNQCVDPTDGKTYWQSFLYSHATFQKGCCDFHPGCPDSGDGEGIVPYLMGEDVCHRGSGYMFDGQKTWASWLQSSVGNIAGFRLDAVKNFDWAMAKALPGWKVGEYWDSKTAILDWIAYTGCNAFDFPLYEAMKGSASALNGAGLCSAKGVSFVGNHDTDDVSQKIRAYGFIMYIEPTPCVYWPHWFSTMKTPIQRALTARTSNDFSGTSTIYNTTNLIIFKNTGLVYGVFNSGSAWAGGWVQLTPGKTYTAIAWGGSDDAKPQDKTADGSGWVELWSSGAGYAYYK